MAVAESRYRSLPTSLLVQRIVDECDIEALNELLGRRPLFQVGEDRLLLPDFLRELRQRAEGKHSTNVLACGYDRALDRFAALPQTMAEKRASGPNCLRQYSAALRLVVGWRRQNPRAGELEEEAQVAQILQRLVVKHFHLSMVDCLRDAPSGYRRYAWHVGDRVLVLRCPHYLSGAQLRAWLESRFPQTDSESGEEATRIQQEIDLQFPRMGQFSLDAMGDSVPDPARSLGGGAMDGESRRQVRSLVDILVNEKAARIEHQRPAIQRLGKARLSALIRQIMGL